MDIKKILQEKGYRFTTQRQEVIKSLGDFLLSVQEIHRSLKKRRVNIDLVSIYRTLELLVSMGIVHAIELGEGKKRYEVVNEKNHHHHLVCNSCGSIDNITVNEEQFIKEIKKKSTFKVDHHHLEFFGCCQNCQ